MKARMSNPVTVVPGAMKALQALVAATNEGGVSERTLGLVHLRTSQINGCSLCVDVHRPMARKHGETEERMFAVAAWREAPYFDDAERAALALTEATTRLADGGGVPDAVWEEAARHYDEKQLATLVLAIGMVNLFNRVNGATRQIAGTAPWKG